MKIPRYFRYFFTTIIVVLICNPSFSQFNGGCKNGYNSASIGGSCLTGACPDNYPTPGNTTQNFMNVNSTPSYGGNVFPCAGSEVSYTNNIKFNTTTVQGTGATYTVTIILDNSDYIQNLVLPTIPAFFSTSSTASIAIPSSSPTASVNYSSQGYTKTVGSGNSIVIVLRRTSINGLMNTDIPFNVSYTLSSTTPDDVPMNQLIRAQVNGITSLGGNTCQSRTLGISALSGCSRDPNEKIVTPKGCGPDNLISKNDSLTYYLMFQNVGSAPALTVQLTDTLSPFLDINSFEVLHGSHEFTYRVLPGNILTVRFDSIYLPDSSTDLAGSQGSFVFRIQPKSNVAPGTRINNKTAIKFDNNEIIMTNTVFNTIQDETPKTVTIANKTRNVCPTRTLYRAINLNGSSSMLIDGQTWEAGNSSTNLSFVGRKVSNQSISLIPVTDANRTSMIRTSIKRNADSDSIVISVNAVPSGRYEVYAYTYEDCNSPTFDVYLEGLLKFDNSVPGPTGTWKRLSLGRTNVTDGNIKIKTIGGDPNISGIEIWRIQDVLNETFTASLAKSYLWNTGDTTQSITVATPGTYYVTASFDNSCVVSTDTAMLTSCQEQYTVYQVNVGGSQVVTPEGTFIGDSYFVPNTSYPYKNSNAFDVLNTTNDELYKSERYAGSSKSMEAQFPVENGSYVVKLHFAEIYFGVAGGEAGGTGSRIFDVKIENSLKLNNYDIFSEVGARTAVIKTFNVNVTDGVLGIEFLSKVGNAKVSAIEVIRKDVTVAEQPAEPTALYRINSGGPQVNTFIGTFSADANYIASGSTPQTYTLTGSHNIANTENDDIYKTERYSGTSQNVAYQFPVANGLYTVKLHFAEIYFGVGGLAGGPGTRVFDIKLENTIVLPNYDITADVGVLTAVVKSFDVNITDGTLNISLINKVANAKVSAIEVIKQSTGSSQNLRIAETEESERKIEKSAVYLYPNPSRDKVSLRFERKPDSTVKIKIVDLLGVPVYKTSTSSNTELTLDTDVLKRGSYYIEVQYDNYREVLRLIKE